MSNSLILKNSIILYIRLIITSIVGIITTRILLNSLGVQDFGLYAIVGGIVLMMNFLNTALISTSFRFIAFELGKNENGNPNKIFNISLFLHLALGVILILLAETFGKYYIYNYLIVASNRIDVAIFVFRLSVMASVFAIISIPFQGLITAKESFLARSSIEILMSFAKLVAVILIINFAGDKLIFYAKLMLIASILGPLAFIIFSKIKYKEITVIKFYKDKKTYNEFIKFSTWIMIGAGASIGKIQGAAVLINMFFGTVLNATFGLANQLNTFILMFAQNIGQATIPQITKSFSSGDLERTKTLTASISKFSFFLMLIPSVPLLFNTEYVLILWLKELPPHIIIICQLMIVNALIDSSVAGLPAAIQATGKIKYYQIILSSIMLMALPITYLLYKNNFPVQTIVIVFISISIINNILSQYFLKNTLGFEIKDYFKKVYLGIFSVLVLISPIYFLNNFLDKNFVSFFLFSMISTIWIVLLIYSVGLNNSEKIQVKKVVQKLKLKIQ